MPADVSSHAPAADPAPRTVVPSMGADPSAIAGNSAPQCLSTYKYINGLYLVSFLQYLLSAAPEHDEAKNSTICAAITTGSSASDFAGSAFELA
jgi:hypothetical protein